MGATGDFRYGSIKKLPQEMGNDKELYCNCISGAVPINDLKNILLDAGFTDMSRLTHKKTAVCLLKIGCLVLTQKIM